MPDRQIIFVSQSVIVSLYWPLEWKLNLMILEQLKRIFFLNILYGFLFLKLDIKEQDKSERKNKKDENCIFSVICIHHRYFFTW